MNVNYMSHLFQIFAFGTPNDFTELEFIKTTGFLIASFSLFTWSVLYSLTSSVQ